ncbi:MAG: hypothetical protein HND49_17885 [Planctomycetes bacterium]|nr:hypothetical protein [Planctomycetota bacterium]
MIKKGGLFKTQSSFQKPMNRSHDEIRERALSTWEGIGSRRHGIDKNRGVLWARITDK